MTRVRQMSFRLPTLSVELLPVVPLVATADCHDAAPPTGPAPAQASSFTSEAAL